MQLSKLKAMGAFVSIAPVKKTVPIERPIFDADGNATGEIVNETLDTFVRKGSAADAIQMANAGDEDQVFVAIFRAICNEDGSPLFESVDQALIDILKSSFAGFEANPPNGGQQKSRLVGGLSQ